MLTLREESLSTGFGSRGGQGPAGRPRAVVIGAGLGGLSAAARIGAKGYDVTVLERLDAPGGRGYQYQRDGYRFDAGPTILTAPFVFEDLWKACGRDFHQDVTLQRLDPMYRIRFDDGDVFDASSDTEKMRAEVARISPGDLEAYKRFEQESGEIYRYAFEKVANEPANSFIDFLKMLPPLIRLGGYQSPHFYISRRIKHPKLRFALSFHPLFIGGNPFQTSSFYCLINHLEQGWGVSYVMGGTGALMRAMADLVPSVGGRIRYNATVGEITTDGRRVTGVKLQGGETLPADIVVSNADVATTYRTMLPSVRRRVWTDAKLDRMNYSMSVFVWYFGTNRRYDDVKHHTIALCDRYRPLIKDIFHKKRITEDFSLYLYRPTATDPSMAPEGHDSFYALVPVPHLDSGDDWGAEFAEAYRRRVQKRLEETLLPGLGEAVTTSFVTTPRDFQTRLLSAKGAAFGFEPRLFQSGWFRPHNNSEEVEGLYFAGAGTHPGAGLPGTVGSGAIVAGLVPEPATLG
jgi:phytoene desaturase